MYTLFVGPGGGGLLDTNKIQNVTLLFMSCLSKTNDSGSMGETKCNFSEGALRKFSNSTTTCMGSNSNPFIAHSLPHSKVIGTVTIMSTQS
jgi:hypothetical protein